MEKLKLLNLRAFRKEQKERVDKNQYFISMSICPTWGVDPPCGMHPTNGGIKKMRETVPTLTELSFKLCVCVHVCVCV